MFKLRVALLVAFCAIIPASAHNGAVAIATPLRGIIVDGDLGDWPDDLPRYPLRYPEYGDAPGDDADFRGWFRVGHGEDGSIYIAVEVIDESIVITGPDDSWDSQDGCEVYLSETHGSSTTQGARQFILRGNGPPSEPAVAQVRRTDTTHTYEWRIPVTGTREDIAIDVAVSDRDQDGSFSWIAWGRQTWKVSSVERLGDLILSRGRTGQVKGHIDWTDPREGKILGFVVAQPRAMPGIEVRTRPESDGSYRIALPPGVHDLFVGYRGLRTRIGTARVTPDAQIELNRVTVPSPPRRTRHLPAGTVTRAGEGTTQLAGPGRSRGLWHVFDRTDGLPLRVVTTICQDRRRRLWFGGLGSSGVSVYDGTSITVYSIADGLPANDVTAIHEDAKGNLWLGYEDGDVTRFDGHHFRTWSPADGLPGGMVDALLEDRHGRIWVGSTAGLARFDDTSLALFTEEDGLPHTAVYSLAEDSLGGIWVGTGDGVGRVDEDHIERILPDVVGPVLAVIFDSHGDAWLGTMNGVVHQRGQVTTRHTQQDGIRGVEIYDIAEDHRGSIWAATYSGMNRYRSGQWTSFTTADGLSSSRVQSILVDVEGNVWAGTSLGGVVRYDGNSIDTYSTLKNPRREDNLVFTVLADDVGAVYSGSEDGGVSILRGDHAVVLHGPWPPQATVGDMLRDKNGGLWIAFDHRLYSGAGTGVMHLDRDGKATSYSSADGLLDDSVIGMYEDTQGRIWFATPKGVATLDDRGFRNFTVHDGLPGSQVQAITETADGHVLFGTNRGLGRFDGTSIRAYAPHEDLVQADVTALLSTPSGDVWIGTMDGRLYYSTDDGSRSLASEDGVPPGSITCLAMDQRQRLWIGTAGGGVGVFDGLVFQGITEAEGLANNTVMDIDIAADESAWIATADGLTHYRPSRTPPPAVITDVITDHHLGSVDEITVGTDQDIITIEFGGTSYRTRPDRLAFVYTLAGGDEKRQWTRRGRAELHDLPRGSYRFLVWAVDRDLNYSSEAAVLRIRVDPAYGRIAIWTSLILSVVLLVAATGYGIRRRQELELARDERDRTREELLAEQEEELATARDLQMALMPSSPPRIPGFDLDGECRSAKQVGGDLFKYFLSGPTLTLATADVSGHAMEAAIPVVMFSGILEKQMEFSGTLTDRFQSLNRSLCRALSDRRFVCLTMVDIDTSTGEFSIASGGSPYALHYQTSSSRLVELALDAYPLGVREDSRYEPTSSRLEAGDYIILYSDGIPECTDEDGEYFGYERTMTTIADACRAGASAKSMVEVIMGRARQFAASEPQTDDMTCVVVRMESSGEA